jgi:hypothetical protein
MSPDPLPWLDWQHRPEDASDEEKQESLQKFRDWISNPQHFNLYVYVLNNPLRFTDPDGEAELNKDQVVKIIQQAVTASTTNGQVNNGQLAANILKALPTDSSVSGKTLSEAITATGVKLDSTVGSLLSNASSVSRSGDTIQITSKGDFTVQAGDHTLKLSSSISLHVGTENGSVALTSIKGVNLGPASISKIVIGSKAASVTVGVGFLKTTQQIPY